MVADCEKPETCRRCGQEGHRVKDCDQEEQTRTRTNEDGTTTEIYVPKEISDDNLFEQGISSGINFDKFDKIPVGTVACVSDFFPPWPSYFLTRICNVA